MGRGRLREGVWKVERAGCYAVLYVSHQVDVLPQGGSCLHNHEDITHACDDHYAECAIGSLFYV